MSDPAGRPGEPGPERAAPDLNEPAGPEARLHLVQGPAAEVRRHPAVAVSWEAARSTLAALSQVALQGSPPDKLANRVAGLLAALFTADRCDILELRGHPANLRLLGGHGVGTERAGAPLNPWSGTPLADRVLSAEFPVFVEDLGEEPGGRSFLGDLGIASSLAVRVTGPEGASGALGVHWKRRRQAAPEELDLLAATAWLLAVALQGARSEEAFQRTQEQLHHSQRMEAVGRLAGGIAHDFNNLLTAISCYTSLGAQSLPTGHPVLEDLREIQRAAARASSMTQQLLSFGRRQTVRSGRVDVDLVVEDTVRMLSSLLGEDVRVEFRPSGHRHTVRADPGQVAQVLLNLAINARDAMPDGGTLSLEVDLVTLPRDGTPDSAVSPRGETYVRLLVRDTGHGLDAETQERIFEPFFTTKPHGMGSGLGLSTVYDIARQAGGMVLVHSAPGQGRCFKVLLPRLGDGEPSASGEVRAVAADGSRGEPILLVADERSVRNLVKRILFAHGYPVLAAASPLEALEILERYDGPLQLLVTDVVLPDMNGPDLAARVEKLRPGLRTLFISGYSEETMVSQGILEPGSHFLAKPFTPESLLHRVRMALDDLRDA